MKKLTAKQLMALFKETTNKHKIAQETSLFILITDGEEVEFSYKGKEPTIIGLLQQAVHKILLDHFKEEDK